MIKASISKLKTEGISVFCFQLTYSVSFYHLNLRAFAGLFSGASNQIKSEFGMHFRIWAGTGQFVYNSHNYISVSASIFNITTCSIWGLDILQVIYPHRQIVDLSNSSVSLSHSSFMNPRRVLDLYRRNP